MGAKGRKKAMRLRDEAQGALEASFNAGWLDESLVQAAWVRTTLDFYPIGTDLTPS